MGHKKSVPLETAVAAYMDTLTPASLSRSTLDSKTRTMSYLIDFVGRRNKSVRKLTNDDFIGLMARLSKPAGVLEAAGRKAQGLSPRLGRSPNSLRGDRATLNQFIQFCKREGWMDPAFDPLWEVTRSKRVNGHRAARFAKRNVPFEEWPALLDAAGTVSPATRMLVAVALLCGRRASEVAFLRWGDIKNGRVHFWNIKLGRVAHAGGMPVSPWLQRELDTYTAWYRQHTGIAEPEPEWPLVPTRLQPAAALDTGVKFAQRDRGAWPLNLSKNLTPNNVTREIRDALEAHGWTDEELYGEGGHTLRRSFALHLEDVADLEAATAALDHDSSKMTAQYTGRRGGRKAMEKALGAMGATPPTRPAESPAEAPATPAPTTVHPWGSKPAQPVQEKTHMASVVDLFSRRRIA